MIGRRVDHGKRQNGEGRIRAAVCHGGRAVHLNLRQTARAECARSTALGAAQARAATAGHAVLLPRRMGRVVGRRRDGMVIVDAPAGGVFEDV